MIKKLSAFLFLAAVVGFAAFTIYRREKASLLEQSVLPVPEATTAANPGTPPTTTAHRAMYYEKRAGDVVLCKLCPNACRLSDGQLGTCRARKNIGGELYSLVYGRLATSHVDPIEKKPFFHFLPGSQAFSIATPGCNMHCLFCQNWEISQAFPWQIPTANAPPEDIVKAALQSGCQSIAFTYSEPIICYEYMLDVARLARAKGLKVAVISNGYINPEPLKELLAYVDAYKVDFKSFDDKFYQEMTGGTVAPILESLKIIRQQGVWLEIVNLLVTDKNDSEKTLRGMTRWIRANLGPDVPVHFSRFHPQYKLLNIPPTPVERIIRARQIALEEGLKYVYTGNVAYPEGECTYSPKTGNPVIRRQGYYITENLVKNGKGPEGEDIPGVWK